MHLHSHFNLCARRRPTGPQTMSLVLCALTCYMQMRFLPACPPACPGHKTYINSQLDAVAVVVVASPACCFLLLSLLLVICRCVCVCVWGRLRVHTNKYCNDVCDFFYAALTKAAAPTAASALPPPAAYQFIEISLGPATTTWHSTRAKFVEKICNIRFNEVTTWQRKKKSH